MYFSVCLVQGMKMGDVTSLSRMVFLLLQLFCWWPNAAVIKYIRCVPEIQGYSPLGMPQTQASEAIRSLFTASVTKRLVLNMTLNTH